MNRKKSPKSKDSDENIRRNIPTAVIRRLARELLVKHSDINKISADAVEVLQDLAEDFILNLFERAWSITQYTDHLTVTASDIQLVEELGNTGFCKFFNYYFE